MKQLFLLVFALVAGSAFASGKPVLQFRSTGGTQLIVFNDANAPRARCLCDQFRVIVRRPTQVGVPFVREVTIESYDIKDVSQHELKRIQNMRPVNRNPRSPVATEPLTFERNGFRKQNVYRIIGLRPACMNASSAACKKLVPEVSGVFDSLDVAKLKALSSTAAVLAAHEAVP